MSDNGLAEPSATSDEALRGVVFDECASVASTYGSIVEMKTAPIHLTGLKAARFEAAKRSRVSQPARPLPLD